MYQINKRDLSYTERLRILDLPTLEYRRLRADMIQVYKSLHGYDQCSDTTLLILSKTAPRGNQLKLYKQSSKTELRKNSSSVRVVGPWKSLPDEVVTAPSVNSFKESSQQPLAQSPLKVHSRMIYEH